MFFLFTSGTMLNRGYELRDYQQEGIDQIIALRRTGHKSILRQQPTGTGKSLEILEFALRAIDKGNSVLLCAPYPHLVDNLERYFLKLGIQPQIHQGTRKVKEPHPLVTIACVPTLVKRIKDGLFTFVPKLVLYDESHHLKSNSWYSLTQHFRDVFSIFWTATPTRLDGQGFEDVCTALVPGKPVKWFIEQGHLSFYRYLESPYVKEEGDKTILAGKLIDTWLYEAENFPTLVYAPSIEQSKAIVAGYNLMAKERYGREIAIHLDGSMPKKFVKNVLAAFGTKVTIISTVDMISEGVDLPNCWCVQLASYSDSVSKVIQRWGRALRPQEGKVAVFLDHVGISGMHGLPDDHREWSLAGAIDPEKLKLYCYLCTGLLARDRRTVSGLSIECPHCQGINFFERETKEGVAGVRGNYDLDPTAQLIEVRERSQTRQIKQILKKREQQSNKPFWAVYKALVIPDLELPDFMQLCFGLGYKPNYAHKLYRDYKILHTNYTELCYTKTQLGKAIGDSPDRYWNTYCTIHKIDVSN
jgi:superfamily II DNA or RNA helicase